MSEIWTGSWLTEQILLIFSRWPRREAPLTTNNEGCEASGLCLIKLNKEDIFYDFCR